MSLLNCVLKHIPSIFFFETIYIWRKYIDKTISFGHLTIIFLDVFFFHHCFAGAERKEGRRFLEGLKGVYLSNPFIHNKVSHERSFKSPRYFCSRHVWQNPDPTLCSKRKHSWNLTYRYPPKITSTQNKLNKPHTILVFKPKSWIFFNSNFRIAFL